MSYPRPPAAQERHTDKVLAALAEKYKRLPQPLHITGTFAQVEMVSNLVEALNRLMAHHAQAAARDRPELMRDRDIRREFFGNCSRTQYWAIAKRPDFPKAIEVTPRIKLRRRSEIEAWLAEQPVVA
jgi:predicted DNA-binding transcriptional regulator AlpA